MRQVGFRFIISKPKQQLTPPNFKHRIGHTQLKTRNSKLKT